LTISPSVSASIHQRFEHRVGSIAIELDANLGPQLLVTYSLEYRESLIFASGGL
jgi:hypothetical protein